MQTIAELVNDRKIEGIADLHDESGREGKVRIVIELKSNARPTPCSTTSTSTRSCR